MAKSRSKKSEDKVRLSESWQKSDQGFLSIFNSMSEGLAVHELIYDKSGKVIDYKIADINPSFEKITGLKKENILGRKATEAYSVDKAPYLDIYSEVASTGKPATFETYFSPMKKHFNISVFSPGKGKFGTIFQDITERKNLENKLRYQADIFQSVTDAVIVTDLAYKITSWNKPAERMYGWSASEVTGRFIREIVQTQTEGENLNQIYQTVREGQSLVSKHVQKTKDGCLINVECNSMPLLDSAGNTIGYVTINRNITELKQTEDYIAFQAKLLSEVNDAIFSSNNDYTIIYWNKSAEKMFGWTSEEALGKNSGDLLKPKLENSSRDTERSRLMSTGHWEGEVQYMRKDGKYMLVEVNSKVLKDTRGKVSGHLVVGHDISDRKQAEEALRKSEQLYHAIGESIDYGIWICDTNGKNTYASDSYLKLVGMTQEQCSEFGWGDTLHPDDAEKTLTAWKECARTGSKWDVEHRFRGVDGKWHPILARGIPIRDETGNITMWAGINLDISSLKQSEHALIESEERLRIIAESLPVMISIYRISDSTFSFVNEFYELAFGYEKGSLINKREPDFFYYKEDRDNLTRLLKESGKISNIEYKVKRRDGTSFWIMTSILSTMYDNEPSYLVASIDITETKRNQEQLIQVNRTLNAHSRSGKVMMHAKNELSYMNDVCNIIKDCGYSMVWIGYAENNRQKSVKPVVHCGFDNGYIDQLNISWADNKRGNGPTGTAIRTGKPAMCKNMQTDPAFEPWRKAATERGFSSSLVLPLISEGKPFGALSVYSNEVDPFTNNEIELLSELANDLAYGISFLRLQESERSALKVIRENEAKLKELITTKDKFFNIVAHDLKIPFTSLLGSSELLFNNIDQMSSQNIKKLSLILNDSAKGGFSILQNLLDWSRSQTGSLKISPEKINLKDLIQENISNLQLSAANKEIKLINESTEDIHITADKNMLNTILRNLLSNALKFSYRHGTITINAKIEKDGIVVSVKDSGVGILAENVKKLFSIESRNTLPGTENEQGTGLGLKLCKEFIEKLNGKIWVESTENKGSTFSFLIPKSPHK